MKYRLIAAAFITATCLTTAAQADVLSALKSAATSGLSSSSEESSTSPSFPSLDGLLPGGSSTLTSKTASNAAGILEYCVKNNVVSQVNATTVKDKLLEKIGLKQEAKQEKDENFTDGLKGILHGDTSSLDLSTLSGKMKDKITKQACDVVLNNAKSFL